MEGQSLVLNLFCFITFFTFLCAQGVKIQFFKQDNFTELLYESSSTDDCTNITYGKIADVYSIRTDTCFIAHWNRNCKSIWSVKHMPGGIHISRNELGRRNFIRSFHICNEEEGGNQLNVDITENFHDGNLYPVVVESYKNICSCVNIPQHVHKMGKWSIDNHHNDLLAYYETDCSAQKWNYTLIAAGNNWFSENMQALKYTDSITKTIHKIQSFGPNPLSLYFRTSCNSSDDVTTDSTKTIETATECVIDANADLKERVQTLTNQFVELQIKQKDDFDRLVQLITQVQHHVGNLTRTIKSDLSKLLA